MSYVCVGFPWRRQCVWCGTFSSRCLLPPSQQTCPHFYSGFALILSRPRLPFGIMTPVQATSVHSTRTASAHGPAHARPRISDAGQHQSRACGRPQWIVTGPNQGVGKAGNASQRTLCRAMVFTCTDLGTGTGRSSAPTPRVRYVVPGIGCRSSPMPLFAPNVDMSGSAACGVRRARRESRPKGRVGTT